MAVVGDEVGGEIGIVAGGGAGTRADFAEHRFENNKAVVYRRNQLFCHEKAGIVAGSGNHLASGKVIAIERQTRREQAGVDARARVAFGRGIFDVRDGIVEALVIGVALRRAIEQDVFGQHRHADLRAPVVDPVAPVNGGIEHAGRGAHRRAVESFTHRRVRGRGQLRGGGNVRARAVFATAATACGQGGGCKDGNQQVAAGGNAHEWLVGKILREAILGQYLLKRMIACQITHAPVVATHCKMTNISAN